MAIRVNTKKRRWSIGHIMCGRKGDHGSGNLRLAVRFSRGNRRMITK